MRKIKYYISIIIVKLYQNASGFVKMYHLKNAATFDSSVSISTSANISNSQNDKSKINIGTNTVIHGSLLIFGFGGEIEIGANTFIGPHSNVWSAKRIKIGSYVLISHNVNILDNISHPKNHIDRMRDWDMIRTTGLGNKREFDIKEKEIIIEDNVWIGYNSSINRGVVIGKGAIIGSNTVITTDVPPFAIVIGNPSRIIGYTD
jgi:acetyltransferase-like isoleucine patch superfamily enzyme